jgi:hypothetical protein
MQCYCCQQDIQVARKVKLRPWRFFGPDPDRASSVSSQVRYQSYVEEMTYRWAFICNACYRRLDNETGLAQIPGRGLFNLAGASRGDKAAVVDEAKYLRFQRRQAEQMGLGG